MLTAPGGLLVNSGAPVVARRGRKALRGYSTLMLIALGVLGLGMTACGGSASISGTPKGTDTITVVASGTGGSFAAVTQQFNVTLTVQ